MKIAYWGFIFCFAVFFAYTMKFQQATIYWGKKIAPDNKLLPTGLQDAITPKSQTYRNLLCPFLFIIAAVAGFIVYRWYMAILGPISVFIGSAFVSGVMRWQPNSSFFKEKIIKSLVHRLDKSIKTKNIEKIIALKEIIGRIDDAEDAK